MLSATVQGANDVLQDSGNRRPQKDAGGGDQRCGRSRGIGIPATAVPDRTGTTAPLGRMVGGTGSRGSSDGIDGAVLAAGMGNAGGALAAATAESAANGKKSWGTALGAGSIQPWRAGAEERFPG